MGNSYKGFEVKFNELKQRNVEKFRSLSDKEGGRPVPIVNHDIVKAAFMAGWFELPVMQITESDDPLLDWPPDRINWLAGLITEKYVEVMAVSPS